MRSAGIGKKVLISVMVGTGPLGRIQIHVGKKTPNKNNNKKNTKVFISLGLTRTTWARSNPCPNLCPSPAGV
jgi:hypothetical protein